MRKRFPAVLAAIIFLASALWAQEAVTVHPQDTGTALENPGMGWVFHHYDNNIAGYGPPLGPGYAGTDFPGLTVCYLRLPWAYLEPEEGRFDWSVVDTPAQRYIAAGRQIAFRFTCCESGLKYATPEWVRKAGAKGYEWENGKLWEPDYDDPIYLQKLEKFLAAAGARYDGSPHVAFVDIGTLGVWGEGHPINRKYGFATVKRHIDLHRKYFPHTLLAAGDDWATWFGERDLRKPGTLHVPLAADIPADQAGQSFEVKAGLWIPGDTALPDGRLLPVGGEADRRVLVGKFSISPQGIPSFEPAAVSDAGEGDFRVRATALVKRGHRWLINATWDILRPLPDNVTIFCHFVRDGKIVFSGWADPIDTAPIDYARSVGCTLRDDSILVDPAPNAYYSDWLAPAFWPHVPVILESGHYGYAKEHKTWGDGSEYLNAVEDYHASYVSIHAFPKELLDENRDLIARMNRRLGYRLNLVEASWPPSLDLAGPLAISASWRNVGVAPCYAGGYVAYSLFDAEGNLQAVLVDEGYNIRDLPIGQPGKAEAIRRDVSFLLPPGLASGKLDVRVSVGDRFGTPQIALPLPADDGHKRYSIGTITVRPAPGEFTVAPGAFSRDGDAWQLALTWTVRSPLPQGVSPFCHIDAAGKMAFQAVASAQGDLTQPGALPGSIRIAIPREWWGKTLAVKAGLWRQGDTRPDGRMLPDNAEADRRVTLGELRVADDGTATFVAK